jgi:hypothetical protein
MTTRKDGGPAFPRPISEDRSSGDLPDGNRMVREQGGMSLRDYFAAAAIQGFNRSMVDYGWSDDVLRGHARQAYRIADAMLSEREKDRP